MPVGAIIGGVGAAVGGIAGGKGAKKAAKTQADSTALQLALQREVYNKNTALFNPEMQSGNAANTRLDQLLGLAPNSPGATEILRSTPGYQFRMDEALGAVEAGAAARGMSRSGAAMKALQDRAYGVADQSYNTYFAQLMDQANRGSAAKSSIAGVGQNYANSSAQIAQAGANAQSNAQLLQAQNFQSTLGGILGAVGQAFPTSYGAPSTPTSTGSSMPWYMRA